MSSSSNWFDKYIKFHSWVTLCLFYAHILYVIFAPESVLNFYITGMLIMIMTACTLLSVLVKLLLNYMPFQHPKRRKYDFIVVLGIITVAGFVPRVGVFYMGWNYYSFLISLFVCLMFTINFNGIPHFFDASFDLFYSNRPKLIISIASIHIILLITSTRLATALSDGWDTVAIIVSQVLFAPLTLFANIDMILAIMGSGISASQVVPVGENVGEPGADCHICSSPYSSENPPRILKECGHTVCTGCATNLLAEYKNVYVVCPICRVIHFVEEDVTRLPINYALLDLMKVIEEMK